MKRLSFGVLILAAFVLMAGVAWSSRGLWRDKLEEARKPTLPTPVAYVPGDSPSMPSLPPAKTTSTPRVPVSPPTATSTPASLPPPPSMPPEETLPVQVNLAVPFLSQAPKQNWDMPYQEACEEAALIMTDAYFQGRSSKFTPDEGDKAILDLVAFEEKQGLEVDITAAEARDLIPQYFAKRKARLIVRPTIQEARRLLAQGIPLILPADGKALQNPNFRNGGPPYHMLVLKGYLPDGRWITNDPGTRKGADYIYEKDLLWNAIRDWNGGNVKSATPVVIVMEPVK